jgi:cellulose synthase/poly-beta-1,6-N-acetylglucosamine synthase-like glycosyltransferase
MEILFWLLLLLVFYSYLGYGIVLFLMVKVKRLFKEKEKSISADDILRNEDLPHITLFIASYNEIEFLPAKVQNCMNLRYPKEKLRILFVTDGSNDGSYEYLKQTPGVDVEHVPQRGGKIGAMNRGMHMVTSPITVFCDANTILNEDALLWIAHEFSNPKVGCVSGEKQILLNTAENAAGAGEGIYWKYESQLKKWDSEIGSVVGAAGELFAIRTELFKPVEKDTLLDDFMISMRIAKSGYKVKYTPNAIAYERPTLDVNEEFKRKIRICAGGIQSVLRLWPLLNIFKYGMLTFQYVSHRVLRWTLTPLALLFLIPINAYLVLNNAGSIYTFMLLGQFLFYAGSLIGWVLENQKIKFKPLFVPYYFFVMNFSVYLGLIRYLKGTQTVLWDKAKRSE